MHAKIERPMETKEGVDPTGRVEVKDVHDGKEKINVCGKSVEVTTPEQTVVGTDKFDMWANGNIKMTLNNHTKGSGVR